MCGQKKSPRHYFLDKVEMVRGVILLTDGGRGTLSSLLLMHFKR